jgi:CheY-like chemotaxis protein
MTAAAHHPTHLTLVESAAHPARILVVEDNAELAFGLRNSLEIAGHEVTVAGDGAQAVQLYTERHFDLVLMDVHMPGVDGYEATRRIRREPGGAEVHIIMLSASAFAGDREAALASGADDFVGKPVQVDALLEKIGARIGVEYIEGAAAPSAAVHRADSLAPEALAGVPQETLRAMREATTCGDIDRLRMLIGAHEGETGAEAAAALRALAERFDYDGLHRALGEASA